MICFEVKEIKFKVDESIQLKPIIRDGTKERDIWHTNKRLVEQIVSYMEG